MPPKPRSQAEAEASAAAAAQAAAADAAADAAALSRRTPSESPLPLSLMSSANWNEHGELNSDAANFMSSAASYLSPGARQRRLDSRSNTVSRASVRSSSAHSVISADNSPSAAHAAAAHTAGGAAAAAALSRVQLHSLEAQSSPIRAPMSPCFFDLDAAGADDDMCPPLTLAASSIPFGAAAASGRAASRSGSDEPLDSEETERRGGGSDKHVLIVVQQHNPFTDTICHGDTAYHKAGIAELLLDNPLLAQFATCMDTHEPAQPFKEWRDRHSCPPGAAPTSIEALPLGEYKLMVLLLLLRLKSYAEEQQCILRVSLIHKYGLMRPLACEVAGCASWKGKVNLHHFTTGLLDIVNDAWRHFSRESFSPMHVRESTRSSVHRSAPTKGSRKAQSSKVASPVTETCRFAYRFVQTLADDRSAVAALDAVYFPSLMWYAELATQADLKLALQRMLSKLGSAGKPAALYPPLVWDDLCEQKNLISASFADCTIPSTWHPLQSPSAAHVQDLARNLWDTAVSAAVPLGATKMGFVLKGAWGYGKNCVQSVKSLQHGKQAVMEDLVSKIQHSVEQYHQRIFALQPHFHSLAQQEYRIWCVAEPTPVAAHAAAAAAAAAVDAAAAASSAPSGLSPRLRWRIVTGVVSCYISEGGRLYAEAVCAYNPVTIAVWQFVEGLWEGAHRPFFDQLLTVGMRALRVDCFYCDKSRRVMLNELTPAPDAGMFNERHRLPMMKGIMNALADGLMDVLALQE